MMDKNILLSGLSCKNPLEHSISQVLSIFLFFLIKLQTKSKLYDHELLLFCSVSIQTLAHPLAILDCISILERIKQKTRTTFGDYLQAPNFSHPAELLMSSPSLLCSILTLIAQKRNVHSGHKATFFSLTTLTISIIQKNSALMKWLTFGNSTQ